MAAYEERLKRDLDRWIAAGLIDAEKREAILASVPAARPIDAATALAWIGALLLGAALIAFIAANWDGLHRLLRYALLLAGFFGCAGGGAWAAHVQRPVLSNMLVTAAALVFAAAIGLTGQIFDIAGEPGAAAFGAAVASLALALAGRSSGAALAALAFVALGDTEGRDWFTGGEAMAPWMLAAAPACALLALRWRSSALAHASALGVIFACAWFAARAHTDSATFIFLTLVLAALAAGARRLLGRGQAFATIFYGWFAAAALLYFAFAGYLPWFEGAAGKVAHRVLWLAAGASVVALGRHDRHTLVTAAGVLTLIAAVFAILADLGLDLLAAAAVFLVCAMAALAGGLALRRSRRQ